MQLFTYITKVLINIMKNHKSFFILIIISVTGAVLCLLFSYGLFLNTQQTVGEIEEDSTIFSYYWNEESETGVDISQGLNNLISKYKDDIKEIEIFITLTDKKGEFQRGAAWYFSNGSG